MLARIESKVGRIEGCDDRDWKDERGDVNRDGNVER
jgi:hypothetical protein